MSPHSIIPAKSKIELIMVKEGRVVKKIARVTAEVKKYIFLKAAMKAHKVIGFQILSA